MSCENYTRFNNVTSLNDHQLISQLEENIKTFLDWGFLNIGGFVNVKIPNSGLFGGNFSDLKSSDQPGYTPGQVWQAPKKEWVWETGVSYNGTSPNRISGVYVSNTFYPSPTGSGTIGYNINYPLGQIVFNKPLAASTPVKLEYSYRWCQVLKGGSNEFLTQLQGESYSPSPDINLKNKGDYQISSSHRIQMPCIIIEPIARSYSKPWQMGSHDFAVDQDILLHVFAENYHDKIKITDIIRFQKEKVIRLYDSLKVVKSGANPLDHKGSLNINGKNYSDLVNNPEYLWNKCFFKEISLLDMETTNKNLYWCTLRLTAEVIL